jgi:ABC-type dipeptide/oligopeptide/nickel transport system permease subunit
MEGDPLSAMVEVVRGRAALAGPRSEVWDALLRDPRAVVAGALVAIFGVMGATPRLFTRGDPLDCSLTRSLAGPQAGSWFGHDLQGCDLWTQAVYGARTSLLIGGLVVVAAAVLGTVLGALAGFLGGVLDVLLARLTDLWLSVPLVLGGLVVLSFVDQRGVAQVALVLAVLGWPPILRLVRAQVMTLKTQDYVLAARALGASELRVLFRHVLPNALGPVVVHGAAYVGVAISAEALLSFMGVGLQLPAISWGIMLSESRQQLASAPHLLLPGVLLVALVGAFVLLGEAARAATDPGRR